MDVLVVQLGDLSALVDLSLGAPRQEILGPAREVVLQGGVHLAAQG